jgi:hypothetical protein
LKIVLIFFFLTKTKKDSFNNNISHIIIKWIFIHPELLIEQSLKKGQIKS